MRPQGPHSHREPKDRLSALMGRQQTEPADTNSEELELLRGVLGDMTPDERVLAVAKALRGEALQGKADAREETLERLFGLSRAAQYVLTFMESFEGCEEKLKVASRVTLATRLPSVGMDRRYLNSHNNIATLFDNLSETISLHGLLVPAVTMVIPEARTYLQQLADIRQEHSANRSTDAFEHLAIDDLKEMCREATDHLRDISKVIQQVRDHVRAFPEFCISQLEMVRNGHDNLKDAYFPPNSPDEEDDSAPKSLFDIFSRRRPPADVPLYRNNFFLTVFLYELSTLIPEKDSSDGEQKIGAKNKTAEFKEALNTFAERKIASQVRTGQIFETMSLYFEKCYDAYHTLQDQLVFSDVESIEAEIAGTRIDPYTSSVKLNTELRQDNDLSLRNFDLAPIVTTLRGYIPEGEKPKAEGPESDNLSNRHKVYLQIFRSLEQMLERLKRKEDAVSPRELEDFVQELVELKGSLDRQEKRRVSSGLKRDIERGNLAFNVEQGDHGTLRLKQVPTANQTYDDVKGASWEEVREKLNSLLRYGELGYVYSHLSARGRVNNNMLIVGPYGCGKNMFLGALMADERTIGVNVTTDRVLSMWHGQSEHNTRSLFENAYKKRVEYDKPAVIGWDEFDSLYGGGRKSGLQMISNSHIDVRMQKILQSVLDGDTVYEGVSLIGLTNEPANIPVPIYRRFANVVVIKPLAPQERRELVMHMIESMPLSDGFVDKVDWEAFDAQTEFASGDLLGKLYDRTFSHFLRVYEADRPTALHDVNAEAKSLILGGKKLSASEKRGIFERHAPDVRLTPTIFEASTSQVLAQPEIKNAIAQQRIFYRDVDRLMAEAFQSSI